MLQMLKAEKLLIMALLVAIASYVGKSWLLSGGRSVSLAVAIALVLTIVATSMRVAHHAEVLAEKVGDPYGTMILTLSAVLVEVVLLAIVMSHHPTPSLVRDTINAAVMLDINGILGLEALLGGLRHGELSYNDNSGKTYGVMI